MHVIALLLSALAAPAPTPDNPAPIVFEEAAEARGLKFVTDSGRSSGKHLPETMVAGVALLDYDNDGWLDVYVVNGAPITTLKKTGPEQWNRLFRNDGKGKFVDVSKSAGLAGTGFDLGVAAGDYDNDGDTDLFVAGLRRNTLFRNEGNGTFADVTEAAGLLRPDLKYGTLWAVGAAFLDYDRDGRLDLFVSNYCVWDPRTEPRCGNGSVVDYCQPSRYAGLPNTLFHNEGKGTFTDASEAAGLRAHIGKGMGIGAADFDDDGFTNIYVANDTAPAFLFVNNKNGTFTERGFERGVAFPERGEPVAGMGADADDIDNDGRPDIFVTALEADTYPLFRNLGRAMFEDITARAGVAVPTRAWTGWGNGMVDFNNDGWKDLFAANGGVGDPKGPAGPRVPNPNLVLANRGGGRFVDVSAGAGAAFARKAVHRGAAFGDIDNDGRVDVVVTALDGPLELWRNVSSAESHWLLIKATGTKSPRDGTGAKIRIVTASGSQYAHVGTAVGYGSASDPRVHFGLGRDTAVQELTVVWPSGREQILKDVPADQILSIREPE